MTTEGDTTTSSQPSQKRKQKASKGHEITTKTIKTPPFSYIHLQLKTDSTTPKELDNITVRSHLTAALSQFLGASGAAISVDILKVEGDDCWVRVPREDSSPFVAAVGGWIGGTEEEKVGWRVRGSGNWLSVLVGDEGKEDIWND